MNIFDPIDDSLTPVFFLVPQATAISPSCKMGQSCLCQHHVDLSSTSDSLLVLISNNTRCREWCSKQYLFSKLVLDIPIDILVLCQDRSTTNRWYRHSDLAQPKIIHRIFQSARIRRMRIRNSDKPNLRSSCTRQQVEEGWLSTSSC